MPIRRSSSHAATSPAHQRMVELLGTLAQGEGFSSSRLPGVRFMRATRHVPSSPITYDPCVVLIARGRKVGRLGGRTFVYDPDHYLVLAVPLPFECETFGTPEEPLLGVSVGVTPAIIADLLVQMEAIPSVAAVKPRAADSAPTDARLADVAVRLLEALGDADEARVLGPQLVRELIYRALCGPLGVNLRALAAPGSHFGQIGRVINRLHADYARHYDVPTLAREAGMSVSAFHTRFKSVTSASPLQYIKTIRLHRARLLMANEGLGAAAAALRVGYESASQFSREFKRHFGGTPATVAAELRDSLIRVA